MFTLTIQVADLSELETFIAVLKHSAPAAIVEQILPAADVVVHKEDEAPPTPAKRGRPAKSVKADENTSTPSASADEAPPSGERVEVSVDDARAALQSVASGKGMEAAMGVLTQFNAKRISEVQPTEYGAFVAACKAA